MAHYFDSSALAKLVVDEPQTQALLEWLTVEARVVISCDLSRTELMRTVRRAAPDRLVRAREVLDSVTLLSVTAAIFDAAGRLDPVELRSLDAIHVAAALDLGDELQGIVTYDDRQAAAAAANGIPVLRPS